MKKGLVWIALIISICVFCLTYYLLYVDKNEKVPEKIVPKNLSGEKVTDGLFLYNLNIGEQNYGINVLNDNIYYWIELDEKYEFYKTNIYTNKNEKIGDFEDKDYYCYFDNTFIDCSKDGNKIIYNYDFKKLYEGNSKTVIPYKDDVIRIDNNIAYYKDKEYKKVSKDLNNFNSYHYDVFDNNMFIFYYDYEHDDDCILNLEENKCVDLNYKGIKKYEDGLYYYNKDKIYTLNINNNETKEYTNYVNEELLTMSQLKDNSLYYFKDDFLRIYNLENGIVNLYNYRINENINDIVLNKNILFLVGEKKVYIINLDEIKTEETTSDEIKAKLDKIITDRIENLNKEYNIDVKIKKDANLNIKVYKQTMKGETEYDKINDSLDYIEEIADIFGKEFFKEFVHGEYTGVRIYLVKEIKSDFSMGGEAFRYYDKYAIIALTDDFRRTLCHELMHSLEDAVGAKNKKIFTKWDSYNPKGFKYSDEYDLDVGSKKYSVNYGKGEIYFLDSYSEINGLEDRARIFENMYMNTAENIKKYPNRLKKAEYLKSEIIKYYPMLKDNIIFDSIK